MSVFIYLHQKGKVRDISTIHNNIYQQLSKIIEDANNYINIFK